MIFGDQITIGDQILRSNSGTGDKKEIWGSKLPNPGLKFEIKMTPLTGILNRSYLPCLKWAKFILYLKNAWGLSGHKPDCI